MSPGPILSGELCQHTSHKEPDDDSVDRHRHPSHALEFAFALSDHLPVQHGTATTPAHVPHDPALC